MFDVSVETTSGSVYFADEANDNYKICNLIVFFFPVNLPNGDRKLVCTMSQKDLTTREPCIRLLYLDFDDDPNLIKVKNKIKILLLSNKQLLAYISLSKLVQYSLLIFTQL